MMQDFADEEGSAPATSAMDQVTQLAEAAIGADWPLLLNYYVDHLDVLWELAGVAGNRERKRELDEVAEKARDRVEGAPAGSREREVLELEADLRRLEARAAGRGPLDMDSRHDVAIMRVRWLDAQLESAPPGEGRQRLEEQLERAEHQRELLREFSHLMREVDTLADEYRSQIATWGREGRVTCGPAFELQGTFRAPDSLRVTLPVRVVRRLSQLIADCGTCGFPRGLRTLYEELPELLGCP